MARGMSRPQRLDKQAWLKMSSMHSHIYIIATRRQLQMLRMPEAATEKIQQLWTRQYFRLGYKVQIKDNLTTCASAEGLIQPPTAEYIIPGFSPGAQLLGLQGLLSFREAPQLLGGTVGEDSCCSSSSPAWQRVYAGERGVYVYLRSCFQSGMVTSCF